MAAQKKSEQLKLSLSKEIASPWKFYLQDNPGCECLNPTVEGVAVELNNTSDRFTANKVVIFCFGPIAAYPPLSSSVRQVSRKPELIARLASPEACRWLNAQQMYACADPGLRCVSTSTTCDLTMRA